MVAACELGQNGHLLGMVLINQSINQLLAAPSIPA